MDDSNFSSLSQQKSLGFWHEPSFMKSNYMKVQDSSLEKRVGLIKKQSIPYDQN